MHASSGSASAGPSEPASPIAGPSTPSSSRNPPPVAGPSSYGISAHLHQHTPSSSTHSLSSSHLNRVRTLPTVVVSYLNAVGVTRTVKARIDANVPLEEIVRQLCASPQLAVDEDPRLFALRDAKNNELVTSENVFNKVEQGDRTYKLVSPSLEAVHLVSKLESPEDKNKKLALFSLKSFIREEPFMDEFIARGGPDLLLTICRTAPVGNTLAYALASLHSLTELDGGWESLSSADISRLVELTASPSTPINVLRPSTAVLRKLVLSGPAARPEAFPGSNAGRGTPVEDTVYRYGFDAVWPAIASLPDDGLAFLAVLAQRIAAGNASGDFGLAQSSLALVNALMKGSLTSASFSAFEAGLDACGVRDAVVGLMEHQRGGEELVPLALAFQSSVNAITHALVATPVAAEDPAHVSLLLAIAGRARELDGRSRGAERAREEEGDLEVRKWKTAGFERENLLEDFDEVGVFGLRLMARFIEENGPEFEKFMLEQLARSEKKRCPFAKASNECAEMLINLYDWNTPEAASAPATVYHPFLLLHPRAHALALKFFFSMWSDSLAVAGDFARIAALVRTQVFGALRREGRAWEEVEREFGGIDYREVRERQMRELALEDDLLSKAPIRNLRSRLYQESFDFIRHQRISALMGGSWFAHNVNLSREGGGGNKRATGGASGVVPRVWRFYRLAANRKYLHYVEKGERGPVSPGVEWMPDRIDVSAITDIVPAPAINGAAGGRARFGSVNASPATTRTGGSIRFTSMSALASPATMATTITDSPPLSSNTFTLMSGDSLLAELTAPDADTYSEWVDGLNLLRPEGYISTKETADLIHALTQIGTQVKLLDLAGEKIEIPTHLSVPPVPVNSDFFYSEPVLAA